MLEPQTVETNQLNSWERYPLVLNVKQTAGIVGYGPARIRELCKANLLPHLKNGRAYMIPRDALREWINKEAAKAMKA